MELKGHGHLTYCSNIHPGETWPEVFSSLKRHLPRIKKNVSPTRPLGIGLRLSNQASLELQGAALAGFSKWLSSQDLYVFTMNGFPYGGFHRQPVKDQVHQPDWTTAERLTYTLRLFEILAEILPAGLDGGISTSPLSYKPWLVENGRGQTFRAATENLLEVVVRLHTYYQEKGILMHLDLEPEPDGLIENSVETVQYFKEWLIPLGQERLTALLGVSEDEAVKIILKHLMVCYDVCHFAVAYEAPAVVMNRFKDAGISIGKIQISSALKKDFTEEQCTRDDCAQIFRSLDEPIYLHQVIARDAENRIHQYPDLPQALNFIGDPAILEWRTHFHVPVFVESYGLLQSTQQDIIEVLKLWLNHPMTNHLEVETYTWGVLPQELQKEIDASISRELSWVIERVKQ